MGYLILISVLSMGGAIGIGFVAATKFPIWASCLWGFGSCIFLFVGCLAAWVVVDTLQRVEKHRADVEKDKEALGGKG